MKLSELIRGFSSEVRILSGDSGCEIKDICCDSRKAGEGSLFLALEGCELDGKAFVGDALSRGACAAAAVSRRTLAAIADRFFDHPSGKLKLVGITGTNGKTTTVTLLYKLFRSLGYECGLLSTIANYVGTRKMETENTTVDPVTLNRLMDEMVRAGCEYCFMEASSIGIVQDRTAFLDFNVGIFSNITHDHLDYHKTFQEYIRCKKLFFDALPKGSVAIINADDRNAGVMVQNTSAEVVTYSLRAGADHVCRIMEQSMEGMLLRLDGTEMWTRLVGEHNACNILAIYCTALCLGADRNEVLTAISNLTAAPGRLETFHGPDSKTVVIDYAHTPDALEKTLGTLRQVSPRTPLSVVFGCGGDRDRTKRPEMASVAERLADRIFLTEDNSRSESTEEIMKEICTGFSPEGRLKTVCIADRAEAVRAAVSLSPAGSTILLAGKGHETYQMHGKEKLHFDEHEIIRELCFTNC